MKIQGDQGAQAASANRAPQATLGTVLPVPTMEGDRANISRGVRPGNPRAGDGKFSLGTALGFFARGAIYQVTSLVKSLQERPLMTLAIVGAGIAAFAFAPVALTAVGLAAIAPFAVPAATLALAGYFGVTGGVKLVTGAKQAIELYNKGDYDRAEMAFERIGEGAFDVATSAVAGFQAVKALRAARAAQLAAAAEAGIAPSSTPIRVMKRPIPTRAEQLARPELIQTLEGPVQGNIGDWVMTGVKGERWPISPDKFAKTYEAVAGQPGFFSKKAIPVDAITLDHTMSVKTSWGADLTGKPGDWLVSAAPNDQWIVEKAIFDQTYMRVPR